MTKGLQLRGVGTEERDARNAIANFPWPVNFDWLGEQWELSLLPMQEEPRAGRFQVDADWGGARVLLRADSAWIEQVAQTMLKQATLAALPVSVVLPVLEAAFGAASEQVEAGTGRRLRITGAGTAAIDLSGLRSCQWRLRCNGREVSGELWLDRMAMQILAARLQVAPAARLVPGWEGLQVPVRFCVGWVDLAASALARTRVRDVILLDECWLQDKEGLFVEIGAGIGFRAVLLEKSIRVTQTLGEIMQDNEDDYGGGAGALDDIPVRLTFDLGQRSLALAELQRLAPGYTFDLGRDVRRAVTVRANGMAIGEGELVEVDGRIGVAVLSLRPPERAVLSGHQAGQSGVLEAPARSGGGNSSARGLSNGPDSHAAAEAQRFAGAAAGAYAGRNAQVNGRTAQAAFDHDDDGEDDDYEDEDGQDDADLPRGHEGDEGDERTRPPRRASQASRYLAQDQEADDVDAGDDGDDYDDEPDDGDDDAYDDEDDGDEDDRDEIRDEGDAGERDGRGRSHTYRAAADDGDDEGDEDDEDDNDDEDHDALDQADDEDDYDGYDEDDEDDDDDEGGVDEDDYDADDADAERYDDGQRREVHHDQQFDEAPRRRPQQRADEARQPDATSRYANAHPAPGRTEPAAPTRNMAPPNRREAAGVAAKPAPAPATRPERVQPAPARLQAAQGRDPYAARPPARRSEAERNPPREAAPAQKSRVLPATDPRRMRSNGRKD
ncbi:MAG: Type secretion inner rane protein [Paucimonas sp.]|nr:Type secretion inner rane protein [Paucimonas sp.]